MNIVVNGAPYTLTGDSIPLLTLFKQLNISIENKIIELNNTILNPKAYETTRIKENDTVEIIQFMGGG